jgi:hypothetical protein
MRNESTAERSELVNKVPDEKAGAGPHHSSLVTRHSSYECVRTYRLVHGSVPTVVATAEWDLVPVFRRQNGFLGYRLTVTADDRAISASSWETEELAVVADMLESDWVRAHIADHLDGLPDVFVGKVMVGVGV